MSEELEILKSPDLVKEISVNLRRRRHQSLADRIGDAREIKDIMQLQKEHLQSIMDESDIVKEVAVDIIVGRKEQFVSPAGELLDGFLSPRGLKVLGEVINQQNAAVSTALGMATKITGNMSRVDVHRHQISESIIHDGDGPDAELEDFEVEPTLTLPPGQDPTVVEGVVE